MLGTLLGNYRVVQRLGGGGMGAVYLGRHEALGHRVVVKVLLPELSSSRGMIQRFFNEAQAATAIRSPGIVQVFDFGVAADGRAYIVMELLDGEALAARLKQRRCEATEACRIGRQIANVLHAAHAAGIIHRDLKPDNLFLVPDPEVPGGERVKVLDFGIAKLVGEARDAGIKTVTNLAMGTPAYMSPEQCRSARAADARSDIYSLGCILFELACGRPPFAFPNLGDVVAAHLHDPPPHPLSIVPDLPPRLAALILRLLAKHPDARPQTMETVSQALGEILQAIDAAAAPPARSSASPVPAAPRSAASSADSAPARPSPVPSAAARPSAAPASGESPARAASVPSPSAPARSSPAPGAAPSAATRPSPAPGAAPSAATRPSATPMAPDSAGTRPSSTPTAPASAPPRASPTPASATSAPARPSPTPAFAASAATRPSPATGADTAAPASPAAAAAFRAARLSPTPAGPSSVTLPAGTASVSAAAPRGSAPTASSARPARAVPVSLSPDSATLIEPTRITRRPETRRMLFMAGSVLCTGIAGALAFFLSVGHSSSAGELVSDGDVTASPVVEPTRGLGAVSPAPPSPAAPAVAAAVQPTAIAAPPAAQPTAIAAPPVAAAQPVAPLAAAPTSHAAASPPLAVATPGVAVAPPATAATADTADSIARDCSGHLLTRHWQSLAQCADRLQPLDAARAAELRARATEELRSAPHSTAAAAALHDHNLKQAKIELDQVWSGSVELAALKHSYDLAETKEIDTLATELDHLRDPSCNAFHERLAAVRTRSPAHVLAEVTHRVHCVAATTPAPAPASQPPPGCDADALAAQGGRQFSAGQLAESLASYEAAYACQPAGTLLQKQLVVACNLHDEPRARSAWSRLSEPLRTSPILAICIRNGVSEATLSAR